MPEPPGRVIDVMIDRDLQPPAFIHFKDEDGHIIRRYIPSSLEAEDRAMNVQLIKAVKLSLICFNAHWPPSPPLCHAQADLMERLNDVVARAEALIAEKVEDPPPPRIVVPAKADALEGPQ